MTTKPPCKDLSRWMKANGHDLAALTGQDFRAFSTFIHALELFCYSDMVGRDDAVHAMRYAVHAMQPKTRYLAKEAIPYMLDWNDRITLWPRIDGGAGLIPPQVA